MITALTLSAVLTVAQVSAINKALRIGEPYGLSYTVAAVEGQESSYCKFKRNRWSVGCMGTKRSTVRLLFDPRATRERLEKDEEYSISAGAAILDYCKRRTPNWRRMVACFHYGLPVESSLTDADIAADAVGKPCPDYDKCDGYIFAIIKRYRFLESIKVSHD